jgi:transposase
MSVVYERCCGLDVHKATISACVLVFRDGKNEVRHREFATNVAELIRLRVWLKAQKVTQVAMESTGVYWKPVWNELNKHFGLLVVNPLYVKQRKGHKTDKADAQFIAEQLQTDSLRSSFIPEQEQRELRDLTRRRTNLMQDRNRLANEIQKVLEDANIKLSCVATDVLGVSGLIIIRAIVRGQTKPSWLADCAKGKLRAKREELEAALRNNITEHHRWMLEHLVEELDFKDGMLDRLEAQIRGRVSSDEVTIALLCEIPGIQERAAWSILSEIGKNVDAFGSAGQLASWAGLAPGNYQSAGQRRFVATVKGNRHLRRLMVQCAWAATRTKGSYLGAFFRRVLVRRGHLKALVAVAHKLVLIVYNILKKKEAYRELGADYYDRKNAAKVAARSVARLERLGYQVVLAPRTESTQAIEKTEG